MDREKKIAEIREALEKATQGPWKALDSCKGILWKYVQTNNGVITDNIRWQDAELIANAPEWLRFLLSQLDRKDEENRKLREDIERIIEILKNGQRAHWQTFKIRQLLEVPLE